MNIRVHNLTKIYGTQKAVDGISFEVKTGEILGFLGPNGAGKTTTMKVLTAFMAPSDGEVSIGSHDVLTNPEAVKRHIGYLPENNPLYLEMPVLQYLAFVAEVQGMPKADIPARMRLIVGKCGLNKEKHKKIGELSKGYRQRVGLAQAMIHDPDILILDEPTTGLDPNQIVEIRNLIKEIGKEKTVILSTHILSEVEATCDRILIINEGKIVADGTPEALRDRSEGRYQFTVQLKTDGGKDVDAVESLRAMELAETVEILVEEGKSNRFLVTASADVPFREALFATCVSNGWVLLELTPQEESLEDIFRDLTLN